MECEATFDELTASLKRCAAWLRDAGVEFVLAGSLAAWARGGPPVSGDVDFLVRPDQVDAAREALAAQGLRIEQPPEGWLVKAWDEEVLVDLIHEPAGLELEETFRRADVISVLSVDMPVMSVDDILVNKLLAFEEHYIDFVGLLPVARALREQADWAAVRRRTERSAIAIGFFAMADALGILGGPVRDEPRIRVSSA
ncbi:MAG: nucleotidyltransferase [Solirubrobacteraceae bacterium]